MKDMPQGCRGVASDLFAAMALGLIAGWYYILIAATLGLCAAVVLLRSAWAAAALALLVVDGCLPYGKPPPSPTPLCKSWVFEAFRAYFGWETVMEEPLVPGERYIFAEFPHALYPLGQLLSYGVMDLVAPGHTASGVVANVLLHTPVLRHFYRATGTRGADQHTVRDILRAGGSAGVVVGGIAEMFLDTSQAERVYLRRRTGFVRLAIQEGAHIVPMFFYGNTRTFRKVDHPWLQWLSRKLKASIILFYGRWGLPVPFRHPIKFVVGRHVRVAQADAPTETEVREVHARVVAAVADLYERHRPSWETRELVIE